MTPPRPQPSRNDDVVPPGDDVVQTPGPVDETPPLDRFCDLVLTGGVASGVVYPWAIVELARHYRFRSIGGTSVGAMAAALAAAAEYGRCNGHTTSFEPLRRAPGSLAQIQPDGRTRMLSLFLTHPKGKRLITLWGRVYRGDTDRGSGSGELARALRIAPRIYARPLVAGGIVGAGLWALLLALLAFVFSWTPDQWSWPARSLAVLIGIAAAIAGAVCGGISAVLSDIREGIVGNNHGLCKGAATEADKTAGKVQGITDWLHEGVQRSAGLKATDPPLTFRDLWTAPRFPGAPPHRCSASDSPERRSIDLQMITTNITHGRPYRLPLADRTSRLYFRPAELEGYFPPVVLEALTRAARPYAPEGPPGREPAVDEATARGLLELPCEDMPLVVAARLSLSFPILFSAVPLWAVDHEAPRGERTLRRCLFTDGGVGSNFPVHLFDASVPSWPTFGFWLDRRKPYDYGSGRNDLWLPEYLDQGRGEIWYRFDRESQPTTPHRPRGARWPPGTAQQARRLSAWCRGQCEGLARQHHDAAAAHEKPHRPTDAPAGRRRTAHRHAEAPDPRHGGPLRNGRGSPVRRAFHRRARADRPGMAGTALDTLQPDRQRSARTAGRTDGRCRLGRACATAARGHRRGGAAWRADPAQGGTGRGPNRRRDQRRAAARAARCARRPRASRTPAAGHAGGLQQSARPGTATPRAALSRRADALTCRAADGPAGRTPRSAAG
jgi:predicted acylesterase/phospholipase RssA